MNRKTAPSVLIADDHLIVRFGLKLLLKKMYPNAICFEATSYQQVGKILANNPVQLMILDISMPGGDNIRSVTDFKLRFPEIKILVFSSYQEKIYSERYLNAGANAYLHKDASEERIKETIRILVSGERSSRSTGRQDADHSASNQLGNLSDRELDVAKLLADGMGNLEISNALNLQMSTVSTYKKRVFNKLNVNNIPELIKKFSTPHNL